MANKKTKGKTRFTKEGYDISQCKISKLSGLSVSYINRLFTGRRSNPSLKSLRLLAKAMGISEGAVAHRVEEARKTKVKKRIGGGRDQG